MEWGIRDIGKWKKLLAKLKIKPAVRKSKKTILFKKDRFIIELNHVSLLGYFLEIETLVKSKNEVLNAKKDLIKLFTSLGFAKKHFEAKPYLELLANV